MASFNNNITKAQKEWLCNGNRMIAMQFQNQNIKAPRYPSSDPVVDSDDASIFMQPCVITSLGYFNSGSIMMDGTVISESATNKLLTVYNEAILTVINNTKSYEIIDTRDNMKYSIIHCDNIDLQNRFVTMMIKKEGLADRIYNQ
jgi:hypothetical protein